VTAVPLPKAYAPARGVVVPTYEATALLAYLLSLKQPALPGEPEPGIGAMPAMASPAGGGASSVGQASPASGGYDRARGQSLFIANCAACHQSSGEGLPGAFPPLKGNAVVNDADSSAHIRTVLHGLQGANVGGVVYAGPMPPFAGTLGDDDIAAIINFERTSWGNHGGLVSVEQVAAERAKGK